MLVQMVVTELSFASFYLRIILFQIHLGRDVWISKDCYYLSVSNIRSNSVFVRNLAIAVFGEETLIRSTLSGRGNNRNKQAKNPKCGKLDERKCLAIKGMYSY